MAGESLQVALLTYRGTPTCGGQGVYIRHLSRELVALGHRVEVFSGQPYPVLDPGVELTKVPSLDLYRSWIRSGSRGRTSSRRASTCSSSP